MSSEKGKITALSRGRRGFHIIVLHITVEKFKKLVKLKISSNEVARYILCVIGTYLPKS